MEDNYPYFIKNQQGASKIPLVGGFGCNELVLYGIRGACMERSYLLELRGDIMHRKNLLKAPLRMLDISQPWGRPAARPSSELPPEV